MKNLLKFNHLIQIIYVTLVLLVLGSVGCSKGKLKSNQDGVADQEVRIDLRYLEKSKIFDQGTSDLCYAFATAAWVDAMIAKEKWSFQGTQISPVATGIAYASFEQKRDGGKRLRKMGPKEPVTDGGNIYQAFAALQKDGVCSIEEMPVAGDQPYLQLLTDSGIPAPQGGSRLKELHDAQAVYRARCSNPQKVIPKSWRLAGWARNDAVKAKEGFLASMVQKLRQKLANDSELPLAANICMDFLFNPEAKFFDQQGRTVQCKRGRHAVLITGMRKNFDKGVVEYLVRNSFGPTCEHLDKLHQSNCEDGQFWVAETPLVQNLIEMIWVVAGTKNSR